MLSDSELFSRGLQPQYLYVPETSALVPTGDADMFVVHLAGLAQSVTGAPVNPAEPQEHAEMLWTWMRGVEVVTDHNVLALTKVIAGMFALVIIFIVRSGLMVMLYDFLLRIIVCQAVQIQFTSLRWTNRKIVSCLVEVMCKW